MADISDKLVAGFAGAYTAIEMSGSAIFALDAAESFMKASESLARSGHLYEAGVQSALLAGFFFAASMVPAIAHLSYKNYAPLTAYDV